MFAFCFRQSEDCLAVRAFFIDVSFSVSEFIFTELKESAEFLVFSSALLYIPREHAEEHNVDKYSRDGEIEEAEPNGIDKQR